MGKIRTGIILLFFILFSQILFASINYIPWNPKAGQSILFTTDVSCPGFTPIPPSWYFGETGTYSLVKQGKSVSYKYANPGTYTIVVKCGNNIVDRKVITILPAQSANKIVTFSPPNPAAGVQVNFQAKNFTSNCIKWKFGDGTAPENGNHSKSHIFSKSGRFEVKVFNYCGDDPSPVKVIVNVRDIRKLRAEPKTADIGSKIKFVAENFISNCIKWNFGDGTVMTGNKIQTHKFEKQGNFTVRASDNCGDDKSPQSVTVNIRDRRKLNAQPVQSYIGIPITFTAENFISNCIRWDFSDGITLNGNRNQSHIFKKKGTFIVKAYDNCGKDKPPKKVTINISDNRKITYNGFNFLTGKDVLFKAENFASDCIKWDFGDGTVIPNGGKTESHVYKSAGNFMVKAYDDCGKDFSPKMNSITIISPIEKIKIAKRISFSPKNPVLGDKVTFMTMNFSSQCVKWNFGDGTPIERGGKTRTHTYLKQGFFRVTAYDNCNIFIASAEITVPVKRNMSINIIKPKKKVPLLPDCSKKSEVDKESIQLVAPSPGGILDKTSNENIGKVKAVKLDDTVFFQWEEVNPGKADFFELRILEKYGKKLILKKKIPKMNYIYQIDAGFVNEIHHAMESNVKRFKLKGKIDFKKRNTVRFKEKAKTLPEYFPEDTDLSWEVAGFKTVLCKENGKASSKDVEIELSEKWPLRLPESYTGMNCPTGGIKKVNIRTDDLDRETLDSGEVDPNKYVNHRLQLKGSFNFKDSPYASFPGTISDTSQGFQSFIKQADFNNIFIDWGDGSPTQNLSGTPEKDQFSKHTDYYNYEKMSGDIDIKLSENFIHQYSKAGKYKIRVFMLSENDIQRPLENFNELLGKSINPESGENDPYNLINNNSNNKFGFSTPKISFDNGMNLLKDRAYMLYCEDIVIRDRMDMCADGPLNLVSVDITGFPGHDSSGKSTYIGDAFDNYENSSKEQSINKVLGGNNSSSQKIPKSNIGKSKLNTLNRQKKNRDVTFSSNKNSVSYKVDAKAVTCDEMLQAKAKLVFFGRIGSALVTWKVDGIKVYSEIISGLSSTYRSNLTREDATDCKNALLNSRTIYSSNLPVKTPGIHTVSVSARVIPDMTSPYLGKVIENTLIDISGRNKQSAGTLYLKQMLERKNLNSGKKGQKIGFMTPDNYSENFQNVSYVDSLKQSFMPSAYEFNMPPFQVISKIKKYSVSQARPGKICRMIFPTKKGNFKVTDISTSVHKVGNTYRGSGILKLPLTYNSHSLKYYAVPVRIKNWLIDETNGEVKNGRFSLSPKTDVLTPSTETTIKYLKGVSSQHLNATLSLKVRDKGLLLPAQSNSGEKPPKWTVTGILSGYDSSSSSEGDWIATNKKLPEILISWTGFRISSENISIDFSRSEGEGPGICGSSDPSWVGINLGNASIIPYTFDLVSSSPFIMESDKFAINDKGLCGAVSSDTFFSTLDKGSLKFDSVEFKAKNGIYDIRYKNLDIFVPWIDAHLKGNAPLVKTSQGYGISFAGVKSPDIHKDYGNINMTARNLAFISEKNIGWIVRSDTEFSLSSENVNFAKLNLNYFLFGFNGRAYFKEGSTSDSIQIGGESSLGECEFTHNSVNIELPSKAIGDRIKFIFHPKLHLSESSLIHDPDVQINYSVQNSGNGYFAKGPEILPFSVNLTYPLGNPLMQSTINPEYSPPGNSGSAYNNIFFDSYYNGNDFRSIPAIPGGETSLSQEGTRFYGRANMSMFGGPPVDAQFLLGYEGSGSFFLVRADIPMSSSGIPFIPPFLTLFRISGGLGYNFPVDAYKNSSIKDAVPDMKGKTIFMAGMRIGHPTKFPYMMDGVLSVTTGGEARMDFNAWLLSNNHSGQGNLTGFFQYGGGNFDGKMWGGFDFLKGLFSIDLGSGESDSAVDIHFGNGKWHIYAGQKNGQRIKAHFLIHDADSYIMLGSDVGLAIGGSESFNLNKSVGGVVSGYVKGWMDIGLQVKPQPKIVGDFYAGIKAGVCVDLSLFDGCVSAGVNAKVHVDAPPLYMEATATLDLPWPADSISFKVRL